MKILARIYDYMISKNARTRKLTKEYTTAPYISNVYYEYLKRVVRHPNTLIHSYLETTFPNDNDITHYFVRHDIDTMECAKKFGVLCDINLKLNINAAIYFRVDSQCPYSLKDFLSQIFHYRSKGMEIGLHTVCYTHDNFMDEFERETHLFASITGFQPASFTIHGLGSYRLDIRNTFISEITTRIHDFGYSFSDCSESLRGYNHVVHDCHLRVCDQKRYMCKDFKTPPVFNRANVLILTHPGYWTE